ncbi:MAG: N-acetylmuramoyl-L-alanine amidase, partial [Candidatus Omnitrophica bacterium]|nr:N-acetylmuramoyl-L-alanine amidase [Candidatus Omnitrophota bacterium]
LQSSSNENEKIYKTLNNTLIIKNENEFPLLITNNDYSLLEFTLAPIRLGAPLRNELPKNVILKSNGIFGDYYRIKLNDAEEGYINKQFVDVLPNGTPQPTYFINPISAYPDSLYDVVIIPYLENVPYDVYSDPFQKRIVISLYGVKTSSTWIIHKPNLRYIEEITWQQTSKETYKIYVNLYTEKIWGFELKPNGKELLLKIKYPPIFNFKKKQPLKGIKISIEAGHGGSNIGAVGLSGMKEKDLNLDLSKKLEALLKKYGADVFMVRNSDKDMSLLEKRTLAINSGATIHFSIHANSSEPPNEFLGTNGTLFYG